MFRIINGSVADGTGAEPHENDCITIVGDRLSMKMAGSAAARGTVIDAEGLVIAPGFIDAHSHSDIAILKNPRAENRLLQGITTEVTGNCGFTPFPVTGHNIDAMKNEYGRSGIRLRWTGLEEYSAAVQRVRPAVNIAPLQGHGNLRSAAMGYAGRSPTAKEMSAMKRLLSESMRAGAFGLSSGLEYTPSSFSDWKELAELCTVVARHGGVYATHMRDEDDHLGESINESLMVSNRSKVKLEISHLKSTRRRNWGKVVGILHELDSKAKRNSRIGWDAYPYTASHTDLTITLPKYIMDGGFSSMLKAISSTGARARVVLDMEEEREEEDWDAIVVEDIASKEIARFNNRSILEISRAMKATQAETVLRLLETNGHDIPIIVHNMAEGDVDAVFSHESTAIGSDSSVYTGGHPHPRAFGTFPRAFARYVRQLNSTTMGAMVRKASALTADRFSIAGRGYIREGYFADVVIFDPETIGDRSTYENPTAEPEGVRFVFVNGTLAVRDGNITGKRGGRMLARGRSR